MIPRSPESLPAIESVRPIIGMEVHVELSTRMKMFSRAPSPAHAAAPSGATTDPPPNSLIDPVVLGLPGALPVMNLAAVEMSMLVGLALGCRIADLARWDRKSYFYPDLPKGYQISQYDLPLCFDGAVDLPEDVDAAGGRIRIIRAHLEEDAGKLLHEAPGGLPIDFSIVDLNRAGTPLLEIVTAPDFTSADQAVAFARRLRSTLRFLGVTEGVLQKGHMRFEPNINCELVLAGGRAVRTPITEVKNLNSFRALRGAIEHEIAQQPRRWQSDRIEHGPGSKTTRGWDDAQMATTLQRTKEDAHDYRYFPDPDLPPVVIDDAWRERIRAALPELPHTRAHRFMTHLGLSAKEAAAITDERPVCELFERSVDDAALRGVERAIAGRLCANILLQSGLKRANERAKLTGVETIVTDLGLTHGQVGAVAAMRHRGDLGGNQADELIGLLCEPDHAGADAESLARSRGLIMVRDDDALEKWIDGAIAHNPAAADDVRAGKMQAIGRLIGAVMKASGGTADAARAREMIVKKLS